MHLPSNQPFFSVPLFFLRELVPSLILAKKIGRNVEISTQFFLSSKNRSLPVWFLEDQNPPWELQFSTTPRVDESSPLSDGYYFLPWPRTGNSMDSTQSNNKRGPASFILFQLPLQMAAGTGRETSHGDVSGNGSVMGKKKKREEKERKKRSSRGSRLLLSRCNIRRNKPARVSFFLVWIYARHGSEREWRRKATGNGRWRCFPNGGQLIVGETEFLGESRFFIRVDGERYSISKTSNARSEENSNWEAMKIEWNGKENWYLYIKVYTYIVQVFEKWSRKEDDDKKKKTRREMFESARSKRYYNISPSLRKLRPRAKTRGRSRAKNWSGWWR